MSVSVTKNNAVIRQLSCSNLPELITLEQLPALSFLLVSSVELQLAVSFPPWEGTKLQPRPLFVPRQTLSPASHSIACRNQAKYNEDICQNLEVELLHVGILMGLKFILHLTLTYNLTVKQLLVGNTNF